MENNQSLSLFNGASEGDLQTVANNVQEYIKTNDETMLATITDKLNKRPGLLGVLFPNKIQKEHNELTVQKMKSLFNTSEVMAAVYTNAQLALAKRATDIAISSKVQQYTGVLQAQALAIQADLSQFAQTKLDEMSDAFERSRIPFGQRRDRQLKDAEQYKEDEYYYNRLKNSLNKESDIFFETINELLEGFEKGLKKRLDDSKGSR